jgi:hypothetical protein
MAESHVVSGLVSKRAELAGTIATHQAELTRLHICLSHLDASIKLFSPAFDLRTIKAKRSLVRNQYFANGEAQRMTLDALRKAKTPLSSRQITDALMKAKQLPLDAVLIALIQKNAIAVLHRLAFRKLVEQVDVGSHILHWQVA